MKIIVTGSLGNISKPLSKLLLEKGHSITVISSKNEKQKDIEALGATAAIGSLEDVDFLAATFKGADAVYCMVPPNFGETDQVAYYRRIGNSYANSIQQSGVKRIVHLSSYGAHLDKGTGFILGSHNVEGILNKLTEISITHLRPAYFYYNLFSFAGMIKTRGLMGSNYGGDDKLVMVHPMDIAVTASEELQITSADSGVLYVASDDLSANEIAGILGAAIGKPDLKWLTFSNEQTKEGMEKRGMPPHLISNFIEMGASTHSGVMREDYDLHKPPVMVKIKLTDFAKEFAAIFKTS
jgi:uncharacterized protein YbjT (DUF2867 family)